jgi:hypothetical protein
VILPVKFDGDVAGIVNNLGGLLAARLGSMLRAIQADAPAKPRS